jgi:hypothetical protein
MKPIWTACALLISIASGISWADGAASLQGHGDQRQIARGQLAYGEAKANFDGVIAGLITALTEGEAPKSLPSLEADLEHGATSLANFCKMVNDLLPSTSGGKDLVADIARAAVEPLIKALSEGVATIYNNYRKDQALTRETIKTQLEATKWPNFAEVKAAK